MTAATEDLEHALRTLLTALKPDPELSEQHNEMYLRIVAIPRAEAALAKYQGESAMAKYQEAVERHRMQVEQGVGNSIPMNDESRLQWLEDHLTLHKDVELLYVVDGYQVTLLDTTPNKPGEQEFLGETLRDAIDAAMRATGEVSDD